jgi:restriction endonuclease S subunit
LTAKVPIGRDEVGSSKKVVKQGDVIISRLRPYLRQVAFVDGGLVPPDVTILCSTEFFVIRSVDDQSISFLAPYLLSSAVQTALAAAQEGGHHPRFSPSVLNGLYLPVELIAERASVSATVEEAAAALRTAEALLARALADASPHSP